MEIQRSGPNILVTGTPGTGKSTLAAQLAEQCQLTHVNVGVIAKEQELFEGWDEQYGCPELNEDRVVDELEDYLKTGSVIVDYHGCDFFPERWFDIVFVLRTDNTLLYDRLEKRGYKDKKLEDNVQCEIFQTILEEARDAYKHDIVHELASNTPTDMDSNIARIALWVEQWKATH